jgi:tetratricopeptide (TPR) repeat protein
MIKKNVDIPTRKVNKISINRPRHHNPPPKKIRININLGSKPWWIYAAFALGFLLLIFLVYLIFFQEKWKQMNYEWGVRNLSEGKFDEASKNFEQASSGKNETEALYRLAVSKYNQKDFEGAIVAYQKSLERQPQNAPAYNGLANLYRDQKNYTLAEQYYSKAVEINSAYVVAYSNWVIMLMDSGRREEAKKISTQSLEKNPKSIELNNLKEMLEN